MVDSTREAGRAGGTIGTALTRVLPTGEKWLWVETAVAALAAVFIGQLLSPDDPFFIQAQFPWTWLAPLLIALRYGVMPGVVCSAILLAAWFYLAPGGAHAEIPKLYFLGGLLAVMLCGEYSGAWRARLRRQSETNHYLADRVERVTKRLYLLRLSHDRLEQAMLWRPMSLRDALTDLRKRITAKADDASPLPGARDLLEFLAQYCQLEAATLYAIASEAGPPYVPAASIGDPPPLAPGDPLIVFASERRRLAHVQIADLDQSRPTEHLVAAPIIASDARMLGMLVVTRMPFFALNEETLQMLSVLLSAYADGASVSGQALPLLAAHPGCPEVFVEELLKLTRIHREFGIQSHIVALAFGEHRDRQDLYFHVLHQRRAPDILWTTENVLGRSFIVNLLPLAGQAGVEGYLARIEVSLQETFGAQLAALGIHYTVIPLSDPDPLGTIKRMMTAPRAS